MWAVKAKNYCRRIRNLVFGKLADSFTLDRHWVQSHIADCPRCQRRLAGLGRVELAIFLLKSQSHRLDLLKRANTQAIGVLSHSLRTTTKAATLRNAKPEQDIIEKFSKYKGAIVNAAACIVVALIIKGGVSHSAQKIEGRGQKAMENYYASNAGEDIARDIFTRNA